MLISLSISHCKIYLLSNGTISWVVQLHGNTGAVIISLPEACVSATL